MSSKIDIHAHWYPEQWVRLLEKEGPGIGAEIGRNPKGQVTFGVPQYKATFQDSYIDLGMRIRMMDEARVDVHVLSLTQPMVYWAPADFGLKLAQSYNDGLAEAHLQHPERLLGLATLPMQAAELAVAEARRAATLPGIRGIYMATHIMGRNLDEPDFWPVFACCEELGLPVFLHPVNPVGRFRHVLKHDNVPGSLHRPRCADQRGDKGEVAPGQRSRCPAGTYHAGQWVPTVRATR